MILWVFSNLSNSMILSAELFLEEQENVLITGLYTSYATLQAGEEPFVPYFLHFSLPLFFFQVVQRQRCLTASLC